MQSGWCGRSVAERSRHWTKILGYARRLSSSDPLFTHWKVFDFVAMKAIPLADARSHMAAIVENNVMRDSYDKPTPNQGTA